MVILAPKSIQPHFAARVLYRRWRGIPLDAREQEAVGQYMQYIGGPTYWPWMEMVSRYQRDMEERYIRERDAANDARHAAWVAAGSKIDF